MRKRLFTTIALLFILFTFCFTGCKADVGTTVTHADNYTVKNVYYDKDHNITAIEVKRNGDSPITYTTDDGTNEFDNKIIIDDENIKPDDRVRIEHVRVVDKNGDKEYFYRIIGVSHN